MTRENESRGRLEGCISSPLLIALAAIAVLVSLNEFVLDGRNSLFDSAGDDIPSGDPVDNLPNNMFPGAGLPTATPLPPGWNAVPTAQPPGLEPTATTTSNPGGLEDNRCHTVMDGDTSAARIAAELYRNNGIVIEGSILDKSVVFSNIAGPDSNGVTYDSRVKELHTIHVGDRICLPPAGLGEREIDEIVDGIMGELNVVAWGFDSPEERVSFYEAVKEKFRSEVVGMNEQDMMVLGLVGSKMWEKEKPVGGLVISDKARGKLYGAGKSERGNDLTINERRGTIYARDKNGVRARARQLEQSRSF